MGRKKKIEGIIFSHDHAHDSTFFSCSIPSIFCCCGSTVSFNSLTLYSNTNLCFSSSCTCVCVGVGWEVGVLIHYVCWGGNGWRGLIHHVCGYLL